jgi:hypothetical protein
MRIALLAFLVATLCAATGPFSLASAQSTSKSASRAAAERATVDLKQGMTLEDVQQLLGKPWRTALTGSSGAGASGGTLRWTYTWTGVSSGERNLNVDFNAKAAEQWIVNGWSWSSY